MEKTLFVSDPKQRVFKTGMRGLFLHPGFPYYALIIISFYQFIRHNLCCGGYVNGHSHERPDNPDKKSDNNHQDDTGRNTIHKKFACGELF